MPQFDVFASHNVFDPTGSQLETMLKHGKRAYDTYQTAMEWKDYLTGENRPSSKWHRVNEAGEKVEGGSKLFSRQRGKRMPRRSRTTRRRRPAYRRRRAFRRYAKRRGRIPMMWPQSKLIRCRVVSGGSFSGNTGAIGVNTFKCNSLADPTGNFSSILPLGTDQWAGMYTEYIVVGARYIVDVHASAATGSVLVGLNVMRSATTLTTYGHYMEMPGAKTVMMSSDADRGRLVANFSAKKHFKVTNLKDVGHLKADYSTTPGDPTDLAYMHLWCQDTTGSETCTVDCVIRAEFIVLLRESVQPARSQT